MILILKTIVLDEYITGPSHAEVEFTPQLIYRIQDLSKAAKKLEAYCIQDFNSTPEYKIETENEDGDTVLEEWTEGSIDSPYLNVTQDNVYWSGFIKHTDIRVETEGLSIKELLENLKVTNSKTLPLLIGQLKFDSSKAILEKRLKE